MKITKQAKELYERMILICEFINGHIDEGWILLNENNEVHKGKFIFRWMNNDGIFFSISKNIAFSMLYHYDNKYYCIYGKSTYYQECQECYKSLSKYKLINPKDAISVI